MLKSILQMGDLLQQSIKPRVFDWFRWLAQGLNLQLTKPDQQGLIFSFCGGQLLNQVLGNLAGIKTGGLGYSDLEQTT